MAELALRPGRPVIIRGIPSRAFLSYNQRNRTMRHTLLARIGGWAAGLAWPVLLLSAEPVLRPYLRFNDVVPLFNGRPVTSIASVRKDASGFLWIGTNQGLFRYDGYGFTRLSAPVEGTERPPFEDVLPVFPARDGSVWIGTNGGGLYRWAPGACRWRHYPLSADLRLTAPVNIVLALAEDLEGRIWAGTRGAGLFRVDSESGRAEPFTLPVSDAAGNVFSLLADRKGRLWAGTHGGGVFRIDPGSSGVERYGPGPAGGDGPADDRVWALLESSSGAVYMGTRSGELARYDEEKKRFLRVALPEEPAGSLTGHPITALAEDKRGRIWIGTAEDGIRVFDSGSGRMDAYRHSRLDPDSLGDDVVTTLCLDATGLLWVGTIGAGLFMTPHATAEFSHLRAASQLPPALPGDDVRAILNSRTSGLWLGTDRGLFRRQGGGVGASLSFDSKLDLPVRALAEDADGFVWAGTEDSGVVRLHPDTGAVRRWRFTRPGAGISDDRIASLWTGAADPGGVWVGSPHGLDRIDRRSGSVERLRIGSEEELWNPHIRAMAEGREGRLWLGTSWLGLWVLRLDDRSLTGYQPSGDAGPVHRQIQAVLEGEDGFVWAGTSGGLSRFDHAGGRWSHFGSREGFPSLDIRALIQDAQGGIWAGTERGIVRRDPATGMWRELSLADGIQAGEFNPGAAAVGDGGLLLWGGTQGLNIIDPGRVMNAVSPPSVLLAGCVILGRPDQPVFPPPEGMPLRLKGRETAVLDFSLSDFADPGRSLYRYLLQGRDTAWTEAGTRRRLELSDLKPGRYVLRVQAAGHDGVWNRNGLVMDVRVARPFLQSPKLWLLLALILTAAALALASRFRPGRREPSVLATDDVAALARVAQVYRISSREAEILKSILAGRSNDQIAAALFISPSTVRNHISNIYQKLGIRNRIQLLNLLKQHAVPPPPESPASNPSER